MAEIGDAEREWLARLYTGLAHPYRIAILAGLSSGESVPAVADRVGTSRGTLQNHVERLIECDLLYRPEDGPSYAVTPLGEAMLQRAGEDADALDRMVNVVEAAENEAAEELAPAKDILDEEEWQRKLHTRKWEGAMDKADALLDEE
jgi:hypothetical protein